MVVDQIDISQTDKTNVEMKSIKVVQQMIKIVITNWTLHTFLFFVESVLANQVNYQRSFVIKVTRTKVAQVHFKY